MAEQRTPTDAAAEVLLEASPRALANTTTNESVALSADTTTESVALSTETTTESVALSTDTTTESVALSTDTTTESVALSTDATTEPAVLSVADSADATVELTADITSNTANTFVGIVMIVDEIAADSATEHAELPAGTSLGVVELTTDRSAKTVNKSQSLIKRDNESVPIIVELEHESDVETVNLATDSVMRLEETFVDSPTGIVELAPDDDDKELGSDISNNTAECPKDSLGQSAHCTNDSNREATANEAHGTSGSTTRGSTTNDTAGSGTRASDTLQSNTDSATDTMETSVNSANDSTAFPTDGAGRQRDASTLTQIPQVVNLNRPPSPGWAAFLLEMWQATARQMAGLLGSVNRHMFTHWRLWNRMLIILISGRGSGCCPRNLMIEVATKGYGVITNDALNVANMGGNGDSLVATHDDSPTRINIQMTGEFDYININNNVTVTSGGGNATFEVSSEILMPATGSDSSWESWRSSEESFSSFESDFSEDSDDEPAAVAAAVPTITITHVEAANPHPTVEAPAEDLSGVDEREICKVCYNRRIARKAFVPCGHAQLCTVCVTAYPPRSNCPFCRKEIAMVINLY